MKAWPGRQALGDFDADGAALDGLSEGLDHAERDVGIEQRKAHLADGVGNIVVGQAATAGERLERGGQAG